MTFVYQPVGRVGIGVVQPQSGTHFPFVHPSYDISDLLADFYFAYEDQAEYNTNLTQWVPPFKIAWLYGLGTNANSPPDFSPSPLHPVDLLIRDANDDTVFDSTITSFETFGYYHDLAWGNYHIYEWRTDTAVCRLVAFTAWDTPEVPEPRTYDRNLVPDDGLLDERTVYRMPRRVTGIGANPSHFLRSDLILQSGYNIALTDEGLVSNPGGRVVRRIRIDGAPGSGPLGQYTDCSAVTQYVRTLNKVKPTTAGDALLKATGCYWIRQPTTITDTSPREATPTTAIVEDSAQLQMGADCVPCCDCDKFIELAEDMNTLRDEYQVIADDVRSVAVQYRANLDRWNAQKACREARVAMLVLQPQVCPYVDVGMRFYNHTDDCREDITAIIEFVATPPIPPGTALSSSSCSDPPPTLTATVDPEVLVTAGHTIITNSVPRETVRYTLTGTWPAYRAHWDKVNPRDSVEIRFRLRFPDATNYTIDAQVILLEGGANLCIGATRIAATASTTLDCA